MPGPRAPATGREVQPPPGSPDAVHVAVARMRHVLATGWQKWGAVGRIAAVALVTAVAGLASAVGSALPARAHASLLGSDPANGARLTAAPRQIVLRFSDPVAASFVRLSVAVDGRTVRPVALEVRGRVVTATPSGTASTGGGRWVVSFRVVSKDGHSVEGKLRFTVSPATATSSAQPQATPSAPDRPQRGEPAGPAEGAGRAGWLGAAVAGTSLGALVTIAGLALRRRSG